MNAENPRETGRLRLKRLTLDDAGLMLAIWNDPAFIRHVGDRGIRTLDQARTTLEESAFRLYSEYGYGPYRVALKTDDTAVGICGLFRREGLDEPDIGFSTLPEHCGRGYAYEAACAVIEHARKDLGLQRLTAIVSPENGPSLSLIHKLGFAFERMHRMAGDEDDVAIYARPLGVPGDASG